MGRIMDQAARIAEFEREADRLAHSFGRFIERADAATPLWRQLADLPDYCRIVLLDAAPQAAWGVIRRPGLGLLVSMHPATYHRLRDAFVTAGVVPVPTDAMLAILLSFIAEDANKRGLGFKMTPEEIAAAVKS